MHKQAAPVKTPQHRPLRMMTPGKHYLAAITTQGCLPAHTDSMELPATTINLPQALTTESHAQNAGVTWEITAVTQLVWEVAAQRAAVIAAYSDALAAGAIFAELQWSTAGVAGIYIAARGYQTVKWRPHQQNQIPCGN